MPIDPVCKMHISAGRERASYKGAGYFFCSPDCRKKFMESPDKYAK
ncbi:MAG: YHS domain-containing protein [Candidatus Aenigmarchaeota archaeon]|nr:YHS domain-containing protein [Candidatus Aenigmarchaeota archaeon]